MALGSGLNTEKKKKKLCKLSCFDNTDYAFYLSYSKKEFKAGK
jgi:hypothetical protein